MRRRNNTHCQFEQPKEIDRFKKRNPTRLLFAEQVNYSMTINDPLESSQKSSNSSKSSNSKDTEPFQQFASQEYTIKEIKPNEDNVDKKMKSEVSGEVVKTEMARVQKSQPIQSKDAENQKDVSAKKPVIIIGDALQYQQKTKGFRKGMRRRYSHKNQADYMTY